MRRILSRILLFFILQGIFVAWASAAAYNFLQSDPNIRNFDVGTSSRENTLVQTFISPISNFFLKFDSGASVMNGFMLVAFQTKNFFIGIAVLFLIIAIIKLLFSAWDEESVKKWKSNIIWVSVGIFLMQFAFSIWQTLLLGDTRNINGGVWWMMWVNIFLPMVSLLQMLASFAFIFMAVYAFYTIVTSGGDEEKAKKWRLTVIYGLVGFLLIKVPEYLVRAIYGKSSCDNTSVINISNCTISDQRIEESVNIIGKIFNYVNGFLFLICVLLVIYAGALVFFSAWDEEKIKKAKWTVLYILIGIILLVWSHALFRFFILKG